MFTAMLVSKNRVLHATDLKPSIEEVYEDLDRNLPKRFLDKKNFFQIVSISLAGVKDAKKYGIVFS